MHALPTLLLATLVATGCTAAPDDDTAAAESSGVDVVLSADHPEWLPSDEIPVFKVHVRRFDSGPGAAIEDVPLGEVTRVAVPEGSWELWAWFEWEDPAFQSSDPNGYMSTGCEGYAHADVPSAEFVRVELATECAQLWGS